MDKITIVINEFNGAENVIIDRGNGEYTSMLKSDYDAMLAEQAKGKLVNGDQL